MKIVLAIDSFKDCLDSLEIEQTVEAGILSILPDCAICKIPIADGGEGTLDVLLHIMGGHYCSVLAHDPLMRVIETQYGISADGRVAFIEMARISGISLLPIFERNPLYTTTYGLGEVIKDALSKGCRKFYIGIGGSATNDAGMGMLQALGCRFFDAEHHELESKGKNMIQVTSMDTALFYQAIGDAEFVVMCDVNNPLYGKMGAAYVYAPQKGADAVTVDFLDKGLRSISLIYERECGREVALCPGSGAAGGIGAAFLGFFKVSMQSGIDVLLDSLHFDTLVEDSDYVITGEGQIDSQTVNGKVPYGIWKRAQEQHIPVVALAGRVDASFNWKKYFQEMIVVSPTHLLLKEAMKPEIAKNNIFKAIACWCRTILLLR